MKTTIKAQNLTKVYRLNQAIDTVGKNSTKELVALDGLSFELLQGDCVGIVGNNGSGKSTLLKILSGITKPTAGSVSMFGKVASILDVGSGFHPELTGAENIYLNGQLLGFSKAEIKPHFNQIVAFSEIGDFIDEPVKNYSNGMYLRLAFSIMAHLNFDIYLLDEVLGVGDENFREKCQIKIQELVQQKTKTFIISSHHYNDIKNIANRYIMLDRGKMSMHENLDSLMESKQPANNPNRLLYKTESNTPEIFNTFSLNFHEPKNTYAFEETVAVDIKISNVRIPFNIGISLKDQFKNAVFECYFKQTIQIIDEYSAQMNLPARFFNQGFYSLDFIVFKNNNIISIYQSVLRFNVLDVNHNNLIARRSWGPTKPEVDLKQY